MTSSYPLPSIGFDTGVTVPMVSEYFKYVSIDATSTRASTVIRSMPTSDTRTHASMTIPLSRTRSSTSMTLVLVAVRSSDPMAEVYAIRTSQRWMLNGSDTNKKRNSDFDHV